MSCDNTFGRISAIGMFNSTKYAETPYIQPKLAYCWLIICDAGPTLMHRVC